jgi:hypothetical protein
MGKLTLPPWDRFSADIVVGGEKRMHRVCSNPEIIFFWNGEEGRLGFRVPVGRAFEVPDSLSSFRFLEARKVLFGRRNFLEVSTESRQLGKHFYAFAGAVAAGVAESNKSTADIVASEIASFEELLREKAALGVERQIGLLGELFVLRRLIENTGSLAVDAWLGPRAEPHDFRLGDREFEVKSTVGASRIHTIHGFDQLTPSRGCSLKLISVIFAPPGAGSGFSLTDVIKGIELTLKTDGPRLRDFRNLLQASGYAAADASLYQRRFALRKPLLAVSVDGSLPRIDRPMASKSFGRAAARLRGVDYDLDVEGLGIPEGKRGFPAELKAAKRES